MALVMKLAAILVFCALVSAKVKDGETTFCCEIEMKPIDVDVLRNKPIKKTRMEEKQVIVGIRDCGYVRERQCPVYDTVVEEIVYYTMEDVLEKETYTAPCPNEHVVCCEGYQKYQDNCYEPDEIEKLKQLEALGIIG